MSGARRDEHRRHAEPIRHLEIARDVLEHRGFRGVDAKALEEAQIGSLVGLGDEVAGGDVEHGFEEMVDLEMRGGLHRMPMRA